jgi:hypothetical protein
LFGVAFGAFALAYALLRKQGPTCEEAYAIFVASGILAGATYLTESLAEDAAEKLPGVTEALVDAHQEAAVVALVITVLLAVASAAALALRGLQTMLWTRSIVGVLALVAFASMGYAASLGGQMRHPEIRAGADARASGTNVQQERHTALR